MRNVLISGGGIAGCALALLLSERGFAPTVVERAPAPRTGGQAVDVRGVALEVLERAGLLERAREARTRMRGMSVLDAEGHEVERSTEFTYSSGRLDGPDIELLREDLVELLLAATRERGGTEYVFGDGLTALTEEPGGVRADFRHGPSRVFDLVVGADGLRSAVRHLVFGPAEEFTHHLGSYVAVFGAENFLGLEDWQVWYRNEGTGFGIMPVRGNTELRVAAGFDSGPLPRDTDLRAVISGRLAAVPWEGDRLAKAAREAPDFHCDAIAQVRMDHWSHGRAVLLGDAGYCPTPLSGQGTSLALVGAHLLAEALAGADGDHAAAFARYEARMRPFVALNQALATENPGGPPAEASMARAKAGISLDG
ncbi:FAD-dependent monooxygenase [Streptomyces sp. LP05-1]|uniref:FAD-dependent monooxygenase n=1 Tax=Streptomyces pyxinae TaxID=2970734 RepID=A0ABT2CIE5_9ACTN|nr:FAD-dependent monooxygenase [Streptomyces sp. LP05-1]MCS0637183.1 FAD-dependent monooxygenase [Streptomyces sp. LP05-1]